MQLPFVSLIVVFCITKSFAWFINNENAANVVSLNIKNSDIGQTIPSTMHGMLFETNINRDDDGGLYAELIYNRAFQEKNQSLNGWITYGEGSATLNFDQPLTNALPAHMRFSLTTSSSSLSGFRNGGFYGINIQSATYNASFFYRPLSGSSVTGGKLIIGFSDSIGHTVYGTSTVDVSLVPVGKWMKLSANILVITAPPSARNFFFIAFPSGSKGDFDFNLISCFPPTFKDRANGARLDIAQAFADLKPGFVRFPGGGDLEGPTIPERFIWNNTIGPLENRPGRRGTWTGYNTEGFGLIELLTFTEDIGAIPILAVYAGYSLNKQAVPPDQLQPYIDEVINEIEFLTAPADKSPLSALRKQLGREKPFDLKYVEIGNEDHQDTYVYRWPAFYNALSKRFPNLTYICTNAIGIQSPLAIDVHNYQTPEFFINNFRRYENYSRLTPKVLIGEFAVLSDTDASSGVKARLNFPSLKGAVAESIYRLGFERNSDIIIGGCYAPVLQNVYQAQVTPNLIAFNVSFTLRTVSYLAQQILGQHLGNLYLNSTATNSSMTHELVRKGGEGDGKLGNLYFVATKNTSNNTLIVKFVSTDQNDIVVKAQIEGSTTGSEGVAYILAGGPGIDPNTVRNTMQNPNAIKIVTAPVSATDGTFLITIPSWSVVAVTLPL